MAVVVADRPEPYGVPDILAPLHGAPVLLRAVQGLLASGVVGHVVVLVSGCVEAAARLLAGLPVTVHATAVDAAAAVSARSGGSRAVLVHDVARPLTPPALAEAVARAVSTGSAATSRRDDVHGVAVPVLPLADTVKLVDVGGLVVGSPDRTGLRVVQTPQAFRPELLGGGVLLRLLGDDGPVEQAWAAVDAPAVTVPGHPLAFAVRSAWDRDLAEVLAGEALSMGRA